MRPPPPALPVSRRPPLSAITCSESRTSGRTSGASTPSARDTSTTSYSPPRFAITCVTRGSSARHIFSSFSRSLTFSSAVRVDSGSIGSYRLNALSFRATLPFLFPPEEAIALVAFAASVRASKLISSE